MECLTKSPVYKIENWGSTNCFVWFSNGKCKTTYVKYWLLLFCSTENLFWKLLGKYKNLVNPINLKLANLDSLASFVNLIKLNQKFYKSCKTYRSCIDLESCKMCLEDVLKLLHLGDLLNLENLVDFVNLVYLTYLVYSVYLV